MTDHREIDQRELDVNCTCIDPNYCFSNFTDSNTGELIFDNDTFTTAYNTYIFDYVKDVYK